MLSVMQVTFRMALPHWMVVERDDDDLVVVLVLVSLGREREWRMTLFWTFFLILFESIQVPLPMMIIEIISVLQTFQRLHHRSHRFLNRRLISVHHSLFIIGFFLDIKNVPLFDN